ncbi:unnamed protein product [Xylocopa violacea]|uniref:Protein TAPT1 homolog n=1 Tax=Xylocopa violacea TaxID=135666 RepID=A0ABP1NP80_XYLVO
MSTDENWQNYTEKKYIRFKSTKRSVNPSSKIQNVKSQLNVKKYPQTKQGVSLVQFLRTELTRGYQLENDEERFSARREKIYSFMRIPSEVEKFMAYGFIQCADSFLFVYTFLPLRFIMALWTIVRRPFWHCFGNERAKLKAEERHLRPAEMCDLLKGIVLISCWAATWKVDTSMMYHLVKTTEPRSKTQTGSKHLGTLHHLLFAVTYVLLHSLLVLCQATTLNVAINSSNKALLTIMMSNNFVELKGSVFKKFDKNNLFQLSCADVRERFHLMMLLLAVNLQTMKEYAWKAERLAVLLPDCIMLLLAELLVDWVKHAFITRFNELPSTLYRNYTISLAYDMAQTRQETAFSDPSDLVARRMGFIPLPLGVAIGRVLCTTITPSVKPANIILLLLAYLILIALRILCSVVILGKACDLISTHSKEPDDEDTFQKHSSTNADIKSPNLATAMFSNSAVSLNNVCLNEAVLKEEVSNDKANAESD